MDTAQLIVNYIESHLFEPGYNWPTDMFEERVYSRWAAEELLIKVMEHPFDLPEVVIEGFALEMDLYSGSTDVTKIRRVFQIASDTANDILCFIRKENSNG